MKKILQLFLISLLSLSVTACFTAWTNPTPDPIHSDTIDFDEYGNQTAGILYVDLTCNKFVLTKQLLDKYNSHIEKYGDQFSPKLKRNEGTEKINGTDYYYLLPKYLTILDKLITIDNGKPLTIKLYNDQKF